ncbi:MAG: prolyl oligopeptidase family serine peptidase [Gemmataceae bacterium]|nr:prolyl oligopeptidase family serine peptidase [Gemmataceae bacterium]
MRPLSLLLALALAAPLAAQPPDHSRGRKQLDAYFRAQVKDIEAHCLTDLTTREAWEERRPELRRQFLDMMGLWPLPPRTDLHVTVTGTVEADSFTVEKLHFQSVPGLYVTANLYVPKASPGRKPGESSKFPAVLYVCGHGNVVENGVFYGSKVSYQYHPAWFAANGFVCLVLDTNELGEIRGDHHGTYSRGMWWWQARGYTPAGVELWNAVRALDYLETRPEVDAKRIGLTGRSGGGATSWWVAAADDRVTAIVPVAGIADLYAHVVEGAAPQYPAGVVWGHCDCMYLVNTYRWDFAQVAALCAPRPLLLGNSDDDAIFPVAGYRRLADKVARVYALYGAGEKFQLLETKGPHKDTPELHQGINRWMNRWLKDDPMAEVVDDLKRYFQPPQLKVFDRLPEPRINEAVHETFVKPAAFDPPADPAAAREWWAARTPELLAALRERVFGGWPKEPPPLKATVAADVVHDGVRLRAIDFTSETAVDLRVWLMTSPKVETPAEVILSVLDDAGWAEWCADLGPEFADALQLSEKPKRNDAMFAQNRAVMERQKVAFAAVAPRGIGPTRWAEPGGKDDVQIRRKFPLVGQTLDGQRVWDVRRAVAAVRAVTDAPVALHGEREAAGVALYAGIFEPAVAALDLWHLPASHRTGPIFLNVLRVLDAPQAVALAFPRKITLHVRTPADRAAWGWAERLNPPAGGGRLTIIVVGE